ncbi:MAG: hypothetical protein K9N23_06210 [Akkermansiaceae bacterium]|nr:hypothetical protein [Akkermansiaceae bacterium]MCF7731258.1 hypothetical protein [Akkermansiaceae bacterium]
MKLPIVFASLISMLLAMLPVSADTITLKDGTVLEGKILRTEGDVFVIEYNRTKSGSIKDIKRVPRLQVNKIIEVREDEIAFAKLEKLVPTPDLLTAEDYAERVQAVQAFLAKFPTGTRTKAANALIQTLTDEAQKVEAGGRKIDGLMIPAADYRANAYDMDARVLETKIRQEATARHSIIALRTFAKLDENFAPSKSYREVLPVVVKLLQSLRVQVAASISTYEARMEKQASELESMSGTEQATVKRAIEQRAAALESRYQAEKSAGQAWVTPSSEHLGSLEDCLTQIDSELSRLTDGQTGAKPEVDPGQAYREAWKTIRSQADLEEVEKSMADAQAAGLSETYIEMLTEAAKAEGIKIGGDS